MSSLISSWLWWTPSFWPKSPLHFFFSFRCLVYTSVESSSIRATFVILFLPFCSSNIHFTSCSDCGFEEGCWLPVSSFHIWLRPAPRIPKCSFLFLLSSAEFSLLTKPFSCRWFECLSVYSSNLHFKFLWKAISQQNTHIHSTLWKLIIKSWQFVFFSRDVQCVTASNPVHPFRVWSVFSWPEQVWLPCCPRVTASRLVVIAAVSTGSGSGISQPAFLLMLAVQILFYENYKVNDSSDYILWES